MGYEWIPAAVAAAGQAVAGFAGQHPSKSRRYAKEMAVFNTQLSEDMYNKYESPIAQMRQYKEAGLNPNLVYSQHTGGPTAGTAEFDGSTMLPHEDRAIAGISNAINTYQQIVGKQVANTNAAIVGNLKQAQAANEAKRGENLDITNDILRRTADYKVESAAAQTASDRVMANYKQNEWLFQQKLKIQQQMEDIENSKMSRREKVESIMQMKYNMRLIESQIELNNEEVADIQTMRPYRQNSMAASAAAGYANAAESQSREKINNQTYRENEAAWNSWYHWKDKAGNKIRTRLPLYMRYQDAWGAATEMAYKNEAKNLLIWQQHTKPWLQTVLSTAGTAAAAYIGGRAFGRGFKGKAPATYKGSGLFDATGRYYHP